MTPAAQNGIDHLHEPDDGASDAEEQEIGKEHDADADETVAAVEAPLDPVIRRAVTIGRDRLAVQRLAPVEPGTAEQHAENPHLLRAVRIVLGLALRVMLAVNRRPLAGDHARGQPEPEPEEMADRRMQAESAMRLVAVQENRDRRDGDVGQPERDPEVSPEREIDEAVKPHWAVPLHWAPVLIAALLYRRGP
jgi:hypothetical protein